MTVKFVEGMKVKVAPHGHYLNGVRFGDHECRPGDTGTVLTVAPYGDERLIRVRWGSGNTSILDTSSLLRAIEPGARVRTTEPQAYRTPTGAKVAADAAISVPVGATGVVSHYDHCGDAWIRWDDDVTTERSPMPYMVPEGIVEAPEPEEPEEPEETEEPAGEALLRRAAGVLGDLGLAYGPADVLAAARFIEKHD